MSPGEFRESQVYLIRLKSAYLGGKCSHRIPVTLPRAPPPPPQVNEGGTTRRQ